MFLTVGEISKALGLSTELIRYYVKEGIITPHKNEENNYWEYSSDDLMKLTDVLFYRSMEMSLKDIKTIMGGVPLEGIGKIIEERKAELVREARRIVVALDDLQGWEEKYKSEMELVGKFELGEMPIEIRRTGCFEESKHMAQYLKDSFEFDKSDWGCVSISLHYNMYSDNPVLEKYLSVEGVQKISPLNLSKAGIEERADNCIITEVHFDNDVHKMIDPIVEYAKKNGYELTGEFYGREDTNYFLGNERSGLYKIYALLK